MSFIELNLLKTIVSGFIVAVAFPLGALIAIRIPYSESQASAVCSIRRRHILRHHHAPHNPNPPYRKRVRFGFRV